MLAIAEKKALSWNDLDTQTVFELPERETPATVIVGCLAVCVGQIIIRNIDVNVAAQVCAIVQALNVNLLGLTGAVLDCDVRQANK